MRTTRNLGYNYGARCGQYLVTNCRNVGAMFPPSIFAYRCVDLRRSMYRLSKIDDRCVDLRGSMIDVSTFEDIRDDRCADLQRSMAVVSTSKTND